MNASIINDEDQSRGFIVGDNQVKFEEGKIILSAGNRITREIPINLKSRVDILSTQDYTKCAEALKTAYLCRNQGFFY